MKELVDTIMIDPANEILNQIKKKKEGKKERKEEPSASSRAEQRTHAGTKRVVHRSPAPLKARGGRGAPSETRDRLLTTAVPGALPRLDGRAPRQALIENSGVSTECLP